MNSYFPNSYPVESSSQFPHLRSVLAPQYAAMSDAEIHALMEAVYGAESAEDYDEYLEGLFDSISKGFQTAVHSVGNVVSQAAPIVANVGGGALKGAMAGSSLGLPGIIGGALMGGVGTGLSSYGKGSARNVGNVLSGVTNVAGQLTPMGRMGQGLGSAVSGLAGRGGGKAVAGAALNALGGVLGGGVGGTAARTLGGLLGGSGTAGVAQNALQGLFGGSGAASQLMSLLQRPETLQALAALGLGQMGRPSVQVGSQQTPVPTAGIANLIGQLANQAASEAAALSDGVESSLRYMMDEAGEYVGDPASEQERAARLWELLNEAQAERVLAELAEYDEAVAEGTYCPDCGAYSEDEWVETEYDDLAEDDTGEYIAQEDEYESWDEELEEDDAYDYV